MKTQTWETKCSKCGDRVFYYPQKLVMETNKDFQININEVRCITLSCSFCGNTHDYIFPKEFNVALTKNFMTSEELTKQFNDLKKNCAAFEAACDYVDLKYDFDLDEELHYNKQKIDVLMAFIEGSTFQIKEDMNFFKK